MPKKQGKVPIVRWSARLPISEDPMRDRVSERVETLNREVENLQAVLEAKMATQCRKTSLCDLRVHGVPYLRALYLSKLCFNLQLTPPPKVSDIFQKRKSQQTHVDPVIVIKMLNPREKIKLLGQVRMYRCEHKKQVSVQFLGFNSEAIIYINEQL